jgi:glutamate dehydrogenase
MARADRPGPRATRDGGALPAMLSRAILNSLLPGEAQLPPARLADIAAFLLDTACGRKPREPNIALRSASDPHRFLGIAIVNDDMPFLVDSVAATIAAQGLAIDLLVHPVVPIRRDGAGKLTDVLRGTALGEKRESFIYIETQRIDAKQRRALHAALAATLADVRAAVGDWPKMQEAMTADAADMADEEGATLLRWLGSGMLTQLGHLVRRRDGKVSGRLGICRKSARDLLADATYDRAFAWFDARGGEARLRAPLVLKANRIANVHRRVPLDLFIVPVVERGRVAALSVHAGIWTSAALHAAPSTVPRLRAQIARLVERLGIPPYSHDWNALSHVVTALPRDLLIGFSDANFERVVTTMMTLVQRPRPRLALIEAGLERHLFAFAWLPRDMVSTEVRQQIEAMLAEVCAGKVLDWSMQVEGGNLALLRFVIDIRDGHCDIDEAALDRKVMNQLRGWTEAVETELLRCEEPGRAAALAARYAEAFPHAYRADYGPAEAAGDIVRLRELQAAGPAPGRDARLYRLDGDGAARLRLKIYQLHGDLALSDVVPALENFGFRVLAERDTRLAHEEAAAIHDFTLALPEGEDGAAILKRAAAIEDALRKVLNGEAENDVFNQLTVGTALAARDANLLRAFYRYLRQAGMNVTIYPVVDALDRADQVTHGLIALFDARHDPDFAGDRKKAETAAEKAIQQGLAKVESIGDDRVLRQYHAALSAVLRTNFYLPDAAEAMAFKLDSALVPGLPRPVPWREIFVYSPRVEGIHLRAGPVARGGIRWSDRRDDYRTEILGLMKAQRVKNAVIVPTGAKGGFYPKALPDARKDRDGWAAEGRASYEIFIRSLLSLTDNIVEGNVIHPTGMVIRDGDDPYFVVAADKGTASFSDLANAIAESRDFWLDDAFASGGSKGYDHKEMGITARGAWISVQRHFLELGIDVQKDPVRVAGCGDMSGDVFGNGMLLSKVLRLVAAFDHRHIFIDPDPDPAASWKERKRLFSLPRSSWDDYDKGLISKGGGVFPRTMKRIPLSAEARKLLDTGAAELDPDTLISTLLKADIDLLWFGGIGTFVKSAAENNIAVGDPSNDALRIDGREIRARVVGEGANLGCTQAGRIEFALARKDLGGGRINTDFIDNSAGVDCSDNEVNIKIAFAAAKRAGRLGEARRDALLVEMTDEVAAIVLEDNRLQTLSLSIAEAAGARATPSYMRLIDLLEERGELDRATEGLADSETLARRAAEGRGLTRPELAVLLSSAKLTLQEAIEHSALGGEPALEPLLLGAFPQPMRTKFRTDILAHRLRNEIVATKLANRIVNRLGVIHPFELAEEEGASLDQVAAAFACATDLFGAEELWDRLETAKMAEAARLKLFDRAALAMRGHMADLLRAGAGVQPPSQLVAELAKGIRELATKKDELLRAEAKYHSARLKDEFEAAGAPAREAAMVAHLFDMDGAAGLARLAVDTGIAPARVTHAFTDLGERLGLDWAQGYAAVMSPSDPWERLLVAGLARDFQQMRLDLLLRLAKGKGGKADLSDAVTKWTAAHAPAIVQFRAMTARAQRAALVTPAVLAQIAGQARNLLGR